MALKYTKHRKDIFIFTGNDFAKACFDAHVSPYKMEICTKHIRHKKFGEWCAEGDKPIEVDKFTMDLILKVLGQIAR